jgi:hypothetical protein
MPRIRLVLSYRRKRSWAWKMMRPPTEAAYTRGGNRVRKWLSACSQS